MSTVTSQQVSIDVSEEFLEVHSTRGNGVAAAQPRARDRGPHEVLRANVRHRHPLGQKTRQIVVAITMEESTPSRAEILENTPAVGKRAANLMAIESPGLGRLDDMRISSPAAVMSESGRSSRAARFGCGRDLQVAVQRSRG